MKGYNVARETLEAAAKKVRVAIVIDTKTRAGRTHNVKLYPAELPGMRTPRGARKAGKAGESPYHARRPKFDGDGWRRVNAVCWHGFRDFFRAVYSIEPSARFVTKLATYDTVVGFERDFPATAETNIGSEFRPLCIADACACEDDQFPHIEPSFTEWGAALAPRIRERQRKRLAKEARNRARIANRETMERARADRCHRRAVNAELSAIRAASSIAALGGRAPIHASMSLDEIRYARAPRPSVAPVQGS